MLVLSRKQNETIRIADNICLRVVAIDGSTVKIGIEAPLSVSVHRGEVYDRIQEENRMAAQRPASGLRELADVLRKRKKQT